MRVAIDVKNLALYGGGIAHWAAQILPAWIAANPGEEMVLVVPQGEGLRKVAIGGAQIAGVPWPNRLPRPLRHPFYDNVVFPRAIASLRPGLIFSPYHDVRLPCGTPAVITVHDLCYLDAAACYPRHLRTYYVAMLRTNVARTRHVLTVSEASRERLVTVLGLPRRMISVVPNDLDPEFGAVPPNPEVVSRWRSTHGSGTEQRALLLYPGGIEYRKNVSGLMTALRSVWNSGERVTLLVTGDLEPRWKGLFPELDTHPERVRFLGRLPPEELRIAYLGADAVVYPSLCEGFGRVCLEAMATGAPLACSDLPVLHEVAADYASYFDPMDTQAMADSIRVALASGRQAARTDARYAPGTVRQAFLEAMGAVLDQARKEAAQ